MIIGNIIHLEKREIFKGEVHFSDGKINKIVNLGAEDKSLQYIMPGFIDAHIHIESSMLVPSEFARLAVVHGSVATISDPHEIANVLGMNGVKYMIEDSRKVPFKFNFGAPSCVPATAFETAGAVIGTDGIKELMAMPEIKYLAEMMNYPGVLFDDPEVMEKIKISHDAGKPIDGHAPGLRGDDIKKYISAGITTDHECFTYDEAKEKLSLGMKVLIREGSAAKNFDALIPLLAEFPQDIMFCSDDKHPDDLIEGHINLLVKRALAKGHDFFDVLRASSLNIKEHYKLDEVGMLNEGDNADFIIIDNTVDFNITQTYIDGVLVAEKGQTLIEKVEAKIVNNFLTTKKSINQFKIKSLGAKIQVIQALEGELITKTYISQARIVDGFVESNVSEDVLKMAVINRYEDVEPALAFIKGFNLKSGAIASCVGHDSHNIIAVGVDDESITKAVNLIIENKGGISAVSNDEVKILPLPIAGIMTQEDGYTIAKMYSEIDHFTKKNLGGTLNAPFMTLSFMALLVIPQLKLSDKGLFDGGSFKFTPLFVD